MFKLLAMGLLNVLFLLSSQNSWADDNDPQAILHTLQGHWESLSDVAFSPNGKYVATASSDKYAIVWNVDTGSRKFTIKSHKSPVSAVTFSPDSKYIYSGSQDGYLALHSVKKGKQKQISKKSGRSFTQIGISDVNYSPDGNFIIVSYLGDTEPVDIFSTKKKKLRRIHKLKGHTGMVKAAMFSPDGKSALTFALDEELVVWDVKNGYKRFAISGEEFSFDAAAYSQNSHYIATTEDGNLNIWDAKNGRKKAAIVDKSDENLREYGFFFSLAYHPNGQLIATGSTNGKIYIWDVKTGELRRTLEGHTDQVISIAFNFDGSLLVSGSYDTTAIIWKLN